MDYIPQTSPQLTQAAPVYELKTDVTGEGPIQRGPQVLENAHGDKMKVPYPPNKRCKRCNGRGFMGRDLVYGGLMVCRKCYPLR